MTLRFLTVDPAHFHAALVQKEMYDQVEPRVAIYAPLGPDLLTHLQRLVGFNTRSQQPTAWQADIHAGPDFLERLGQAAAGQIVVLAGRNARKIDYIETAVAAGHHVLADKPWILVPDHLPRLKQVLDDADHRGLIAYDIMTERYEITSILQRAFVQEVNIFGTPLTGSADEPGVFMESMHYLKKLVAGVPLRRPAWFFDVRQQGEGLSDVGTHLVDLVAWILFPGQPLELPQQRILSARRWPTLLSRGDFQQVTGESGFPATLSSLIQADKLPYFCNTLVQYSLRDIHVTLNVLWDLEAQPGTGDTHLAIFRGSRARVEVRQGQEENFRAELYIVANQPGERSSVRSAVEAKVASLQANFPGIALRDLGERLHVAIPDTFRTSHEAHFGEVTAQFLRYVEKKDALPAWEKPNMLAKYTVTTQGVRQAASVVQHMRGQHQA